MKLIIIALLTAVIASTPLNANADDISLNVFQNTKRETRLEKKKTQAIAIAKMVDSVVNARNFLFVAERAVTSLVSRPYITLSAGYDLMVNADTVVSNLPFYGRLYSGPMNAAQNPLNFTATELKYEQKGVAKGKEKTMVMINATEHGIQYKISIEVFDTASAIMTVEMQNGSMSTFYGHVEPIKHNKK